VLPLLVDGLDVQHFESLFARPGTHHLRLLVDLGLKQFGAGLVHHVLSVFEHGRCVEHDLLTTEVSRETLAWVARRV